MTNFIGSTINSARKINGLTLKQLGLAVNTSAGHLSDIENGKAIPGGELLISLQRTLNNNIVADPEQSYAVSKMIQGITPEESEILEILRTCPEAKAVVKMMGSMDSDTQKDVQRDVQKEKLLRDLLKQQEDRKAG